jgi:hypothetical protein
VNRNLRLLGGELKGGQWAQPNHKQTGGACARRTRSRARKDPVMTKGELQALNADLIEMLIAMRDRIDEKLDELEAIEDGDEEDDEEDDDDDNVEDDED